MQGKLEAVNTKIQLLLDEQTRMNANMQLLLGERQRYVGICVCCRN